MKFISKSVKDTIKLGKVLSDKLGKGDIVCLFGNLGSGKTVLAKGIAEGLGIKKAEVISPTFVLMRQYDSRIPLTHFDLYRLEDPEDVFFLGYEEYFYGEGVTVIEWADRLKYLLPHEYLKVELSASGAITHRQIKISGKGKRYKKLVSKISPKLIG